MEVAAAVNASETGLAWIRRYHRQQKHYINVCPGTEEDIYRTDR